MPFTPPPIPEDEAERLADLQSYGILDTPPEQVFDDLTLIATAICGTPMSTLTLVDGERQWFKSRVGVDGEGDPRDVSFCAHTVGPRETLVVEDAWRDSRFAENPLVLGKPHIRFYAGSPLVTERGHVLGTICVLDREPRRLREEQVAALDALSRQAMQALEYRRHNRRLLELDAMKDEFVALVSHELRTPLASIRGYVEELLEQTDSMTETQRRFLAVVARNGARLNAIVDDLLLLATAQAGKLDLHPEQFALFELAQEAIESNLHLADSLELEAAGDSRLVVEADRTRIGQVVDNLVSNAVKFTADGGAVRVCVSADGEDAVIEVADTGAGIPAAELPLLFSPFYRAAGATNNGVPGTGLGLAISKAIVDAHAGSISVTSEVGKGTTFRVSIPR
jgi:signal transduction histidine kinase